MSCRFNPVYECDIRTERIAAVHNALCLERRAVKIVADPTVCTSLAASSAVGSRQGGRQMGGQPAPGPLLMCC